MGQYSEKEIAGFEAKDLRISKIAILKSLIESGRNCNEIVEENKEIADKYIDYLYGVKPDVCNIKVVSTEIDWKSEAALVDVPVPTTENIKILRLIMDEYKKANGEVEISPNNLLSKVYKAYGKYPTNKSSVNVVLGKL